MANARVLRAETGKKSNYQPELDIKSSELLLCVDNLDRVMGMRHITSSKTTSSGMGKSLYIVHEEKKSHVLTQTRLRVLTWRTT